jgi:CheY-like chemotaxis protein
MVKRAESSRKGEELLRIPRPDSVSVQIVSIARDLNNLLTIMFHNISLVESTPEFDETTRNALAAAKKACLQAICLAPLPITVAGTSSTDIYLPASAKRSATKTDDEEKFLADIVRVLLQDDDEMIRDLAKSFLHDIGYEVSVAEAGSEAIKRYKAGRKSF